MNATLLPTDCRDCGAPMAENADQCEACGGSLRAGWFCWACREFNHPDVDANCGRCGRPADNPKGWAQLYRQKVNAAALLGVVALICAYFFALDTKAGRNVLSVKDGEFQKRVTQWSSGSRPVAP